jgi:wyosine [tRNA(Phe)-imidazoG37] synthetase (radical SAM superfamily)
VYCQQGKTNFYTTARKTYVPTKKLAQELRALPSVACDYVTFSGRGEPTLARNLGEAITMVKKLTKKPVAVLTNATLVHDKKVRRELMKADCVVVKLDAFSKDMLKKVNRPSSAVHFNRILQGLQELRKHYKGKLALQVMALSENQGTFGELRALLARIKPDEIQINTPVRRSCAKPLSRETIARLKKYFVDTTVKTVYDKPLRHAKALDDAATTIRRGTRTR